MGALLHSYPKLIKVIPKNIKDFSKFDEKLKQMNGNLIL
jgi:hypothetical protein